MFNLFCSITAIIILLYLLKNISYRQLIGADGNVWFSDVELEFHYRWVDGPVSGSFALGFAEMTIKSHHGFIVSIEVHGAQQNLQIHPVCATHNCDIRVVCKIIKITVVTVTSYDVYCLYIFGMEMYDALYAARTFKTT